MVALGRRACDLMVVSSIPGCCNIDRLVLGLGTVFKRSYHLVVQPATQANAEKNTDISVYRKTTDSEPD